MTGKLTLNRHKKPPMIFEWRNEGRFGTGYFCKGRKHLYKVRFDYSESYPAIWIAYCMPPTPQQDGAFVTIERELRATELVMDNGKFVFGRQYDRDICKH